MVWKRARTSLLALSLVPACSLMKPMTAEEVNDLEYGGYADSQDRRDCVQVADKVLRRTGPTGDMYEENRKRLRLDLIRQCMEKRGR